jgi:hypothetical protein
MTRPTLCLLAGIAVFATLVPRAHAGRDLTDQQAERIVRMCEDNPRQGQCGMFALLCARSQYELGSNLHRVCKRFHLVYPRAGLASFFGAAYHRVGDPAMAGGLENYATLTGKSRLVVQSLHLALGLDLELGGGFDGGFAYDVALGAGVGQTFAGSLAAGLTIGVGTDGVTGDRVPAALRVPVELFVTGNVGPYNHFILWGRNSFAFLADERDEGADLALFGDEASLGVGIGFGKNDMRLSHIQGSGPMIALEYSQRLGTSMIGLVLAYSTFSHGSF